MNYGFIQVGIREMNESKPFDEASRITTVEVKIKGTVSQRDKVQWTT
jgi:hypothetical protein